MKILILTPARCGSSYLYSLLEQSCEWPINSLFQNIDRALGQTRSSNGTTLSKILLGMCLDREHPEQIIERLVKNYDKVILLHRDPRDSLISRAIWYIKPEYVNKSQIYKKAIGLLKKKESGEHVSLECFIDTIGRGNIKYSNKLGQHRKVYNLVLSLNKTVPFSMSYNQVIEGDFKSLSDYLGVKIKSGEFIPRHKTHAVISRTNSTDNWKSFLTEEDIDWYKPIYQKHIKALGYDLNWDLIDEPIDSKYHSEYLEKTIEVHKNHQKRVAAKKKRRKS